MSPQMKSNSTQFNIMTLSITIITVKITPASATFAHHSTFIVYLEHDKRPTWKETVKEQLAAVTRNLIHTPFTVRAG